MQVKKQQLELDMDQQTGSKSGKEYVKTVYCHPAYYLILEYSFWVSQVALVVKNPPTNAGDVKDEGLIPGLADPLEENMAIHSSIFAWRIT